jgi:octaprenyl-diphosphate synthase
MNQYNQRLEKIEEELYNVMPESASPQWLDSMTDTLSSPVPTVMIDRFHAPGLELLRRGGKRWRPMVMVLCCESSGGRGEDAYPLTPMVEMAHNGSLIVDDIEDQSVERRGKPAVHLLYGEDLSINTGTLMMFNATSLVRKINAGDSLKFALLDSYCDSLRRLHFGQGLDIQWHNDHDLVPDVAVYLQMCRFKTGALARFAAFAGATLGGAEKAVCLKAGDCWEKAGVAFQIIDDVKNLTTGNPGKQRGDDIVEGKKSLPVILFHQDYRDDYPVLASLMTESRRKGIRDGKPEIEKAIQLLEDSGSIARAHEKAISMLHESASEIREIFPESSFRALQCDIIESFS